MLAENKTNHRCGRCRGAKSVYEYGSGSVLNTLLLCPSCDAGAVEGMRRKHGHRQG